MSSTQELERLQKIFRELDIDADHSLNAFEIKKALEKIGQKPTETEVYALIDQFDTNGSKALEFDEFTAMYEKVRDGELPQTTGLAPLIKSMWEDYIANANKPVQKNVMQKGKGSEFKSEAPEGEKWKLGSKKKGYKPGTLPEKKNLTDLP